MNDSERTMKYFIIFSLVSAVLLPLDIEIYANLSRGIAGFLLIAWEVAAGMVFGRMQPKKALLGCSAFMLSSLVLSIVGFVIIHPAIKGWLTANSKYFDMTIAEWFICWAKVFAETGISMVAMFTTLGFRKLLGKVGEADAKTSAAIDNAFSEEEP